MVSDGENSENKLTVEELIELGKKADQATKDAAVKFAESLR